MGILNVTPDSYFDQGRHFDPAAAIARGIQICNEGADILDIGGESTRPPAEYQGSDPVSEQQEIDRVIPVIEALKKEISIPISIDTMKANVAKEAVKAGAMMINDVSGFRDKEMRKMAAEVSLPICVMHMQGTPGTMQENPYYESGVIAEIISWMKERVDLLLHEGVKKENIILDSGIGFGKTVEHNLEIIRNLKSFQELDFPILYGLSRKSFISRIVGRPTAELLAPTVALNTLLIAEGVDIIRVHDVKEHRMVIDTLFQLKSNQQ